MTPRPRRCVCWKTSWPTSKESFDDATVELAHTITG
jgi:hypothetical protein